MVASFRCSVSWGMGKKNDERNIGGEVQQEKATGFLGIHISGVPSDWLILTGFVNAHGLIIQMRNAIW